MSQWTHVCGCIRIDSITHQGMEEKIKEALGDIISYDSPSNDWDMADCCPELFTPFGSEGGIKYSIWENPKHNHIAAYTVSIWGDLRDYQNVDEIKQWFNKVLYNSNLIIRDAVLSVDVEYQGKTILSRNNKERRVVSC